MKNTSIYKLGLNVADELLLPLGCAYVKGNAVYIEFIMLGVYLCGLAGKNFLGHDFTQDKFITMLLLHRNEFYDGNIATLTDEAKIAFDDYQQAMKNWPAYKTTYDSRKIIECLFYRLSKKGKSIASQNDQIRLKAKLIDIMTIIENIYISAVGNTELELEANNLSSTDKKHNQTLLQYMEKEFEKQYHFIQKGLPLILMAVFLISSFFILSF